MDVIIVYDIATPDTEGERRLRRVAKLCEGFGIRVQRSVFECRLNESDYTELEHHLRRLIVPSSDRVTIYKIHGTLAATRLDLGRVAEFYADSPWIL